MDLVIVESGAKAKTIQKYLGKNVLVRASVGHVQDLPTKGKDGSKAYGLIENGNDGRYGKPDQSNEIRIRDIFHPNL